MVTASEIAAETTLRKIIALAPKEPHEMPSGLKLLFEVLSTRLHLPTIIMLLQLRRVVPYQIYWS